MENTHVIVLTTVGAATDARTLARTLVDERLAACVNILPVMDSVYRWKDAIEEDRERQLVVKTTAEMVEPLQARLLALHEYDTPEFLVLPVAGGSGSYLEWVRTATGR